MAQTDDETGATKGTAVSAKADPTAIAEMVLHKTEAAYLTRDFDTFALWFHLPQTMGTFTGDRRIETRGDLKAIFDAMTAHFEATGVIAMHRRVLAARFLDPDTIQATFASRYISRGHVLSDETVGHGFLQCLDGQWKIVESRYASPDEEITRALDAEDRPGA